MIVDDCTDTADLITDLLGAFGHECRGVSTGARAIEEASHFAPEIVLLDLMLPDISGYEVARQLREQSRAPFFLAAMTGCGSPFDRQRTRASGFDLHLVKPINSSTLRELIQLAGSRRS